MALPTAARLALSRPQASAHSERPATGAAAMTVSVIPDPRVDEGIENIDDQIEHDGKHGDHHHGTHDERVVAVERRFDEVSADAWDLEDGLNDDRAGEESRGGGAGIRDDRQDGAAQ